MNAKGSRASRRRQADPGTRATTPRRPGPSVRLAHAHAVEPASDLRRLAQACLDLEDDHAAARVCRELTEPCDLSGQDPIP